MVWQVVAIIVKMFTIVTINIINIIKYIYI